MPRDATQTRAALAAAPAQTQQGAIVHVALRFNGVTFTPTALFDALDAAYPTVTSDKDTVERGTYQFTISP